MAINHILFESYSSLSLKKKVFISLPKMLGKLFTKLITKKCLPKIEPFWKPYPLIRD